MGEIALSAIAGPIISSVVQDVLGSGSGAQGGSGGGPFDSLLKSLTSAFGGLFNSTSSLGAPPAPTTPLPYSTAAMSSNVVNDPGAQLRPAMSRLQSADSVIVRDHRHPTNGEGGTTVVTRDHRHPVSGTPVQSFPPVSVGGGSEYAALSNAQANAEGAEQAMLADPTNVALQNEYTKAQQAMQNLFSVIQEQNKEKAQMEKDATQAAHLN
jgi:hypothetical protein